MIHAEWRYLIKHKFLLVVLVVVMLIPSIYAVTFLKSLWDPYGKLADLPVAVVNQDRPVTYQGTHLAAGKDLTQNLRASTAMKFKPVTTKQAAERGLANGKYYMVITIPHDFSHNATTLMATTPRRMVLHYQTSAGHNYTASKLTATAAKSAAQSVGEQVTKSYAHTLFTAIKKLGAGLKTAGKGSQKLATGSQKLTTADRKIAQGLTTLTASSVALTNGEQTITSKLTDYVGGVRQAQAGSHQLSTGLDQLLSQSNQLVGGVRQLATGSHQVSSGVAAYTQGASTINTAAGKVASGSQTVNAGTQKVVSGIAATNSGTQQLSSNLTTLNANTGQLTGSITTLADGGQELTSKFGQLVTGSTALTAGLQQIQAGLTSSQGQQAALKSAVSQLAGSTQSTDTVKTDANRLQTALTTLAATNQESDLQSKVAAAADSQKLTATQKAAMLKAVSGNPSSDALTTAQAAAKQLSSDLTSLSTTTSAMTTLKNGLSTAATKQDQLASSLATLTTGAQGLTSGLQQANQSLGNLSTGLTTLNSKTPALTDGLTQLTTGTTQLATGTQQLATKSGNLALGTVQLATGSGQLATGTHQLTAKNATLSSGAASLATGLETLNGKTPQLKQGVTRLAAGANTLNDGLTTLATSGPQLTSAMQTVATGSGRLTAGATTLATGAGQATSGAATVTNGNAKLASSLKGASKQAAVHPSQLTYRQFATPTATAHSDHDDAPDNGTGMAPYMMSVSLFVGALAFNLMFDMYTPRKYPRTGWGWWLGKASIMNAFVLGEALFMTVLMASVDGLAPIHPWATFGMILITGTAFMSIVYWLNLVVGKVGAFFSMILLVLQLGSSAGTYPLQLTNGFFQAIHPWLPMSYSVSGLRETLMIGHSALPEMAILFAVTLTFSLMGVLFYTRRHGRVKEMDIPEI